MIGAAAKKVPECHTLGEVVYDVRDYSFGVSMKCVRLHTVWLCLLHVDYVCPLRSV